MPPEFDGPILVAEDDLVNRSLIKSQLSALGCRDVRIAIDGHEALEFWHQRQAELVITDLGMPQIDGIGLLHMLREANPALMVVATTASAVAEIHAGAHRFSDYLQKPVQLNDLRRILRGMKVKGDIHMQMHGAFLSMWSDERRQIEKSLCDRDMALLRKRLHRLQGALMALGLGSLADQTKLLQNSIASAGIVEACNRLIVEVEKQLIRGRVS